MVAVWEVTLSELAPWTFRGYAKSLPSSVSFLEKSFVLYVSDPEIASGGFCGLDHVMCPLPALGI